MGGGAPGLRDRYPGRPRGRPGRSAGIADQFAWISILMHVSDEVVVVQVQRPAVINRPVRSRATLRSAER
jgi:hypothetical protein